MNTLPKTSGIGLKADHYDALLTDTKKVGWLELHPENYMGEGGPPHRYLTALREHYPISMHGVGMSLGSATGVDNDHLQRLKKLVDRYQPESVSEHLSWSHWNSIYLNDLLPLPYTNESLNMVCDNIDRVQNTLERKILIENPSTYIDFEKSDFNEGEFFSEIVKRCACEILLDINNIYVSANNNDFDALEYLNAFPRQHIQEIHLAGHSEQVLSIRKTLCIDDHGSPVRNEVWELYRRFFEIERRPIATLIEWDTNIPTLDTLIEESQKAENLMTKTLVEHQQTNVHLI